MLNDDIRALTGLDENRPLDRLESDIWTGVDRLEAARRTGHIIGRFQVAVMVLVMFGSVAAGIATTAVARPAQVDIAMAGNRLSPTTLLLGHKP